jgi:23S rRNA (cytosine1962-C5)-methyltransferase
VCSRWRGTQLDIGSLPLLLLLLLQAFHRGSRVLNLFGYTGGFSVYAGAAGASHVTTVDIADAALGAADDNWQLNGLPQHQHESVAADAFDFLDRAAAAKESWDVVICDPPSFAPNKASVEKAQASYERLFAKAAAVTAR